MSYTSVYAIYRTKATSLVELRNGHGSAPPIWDYIAIKLTGERLPMIGNVDWFWKLWKDQALSENEKAVLLSTYDYAVVEINCLEKFASACREMHDKIINHTHWGWNHFNEIGNQADLLFKNHDHRCVGLGIGCTSVSDPWEWWDASKDKYWGVYQSIDSLSTIPKTKKLNAHSTG